MAARSSPPAVNWEAPHIVREKRDDDGGHHTDVRRSRFPYAIVWSPLPCITWFLPFVGHLGITDSRGVIYDFAGPYTIGIDDMAFGVPTRYLQLNPELVGARGAPGRTATQGWDAAVDAGCDVYSQRMHNIFCDNCHSHVARSLNTMAYAGKTDWNMVSLAVWVLLSGRWISWQRAAVSWAPFALIVVGVVLAATLIKR